MKVSGAQAIYLPLYPGGGAIALKQVKEFGLNLPIIGGDAFEGEEIFRLNESEGAMYISGKINVPEDFVQKVKDVSGVKNVTLFSSIVYDGVKVLAEAMKNAGSTKNEE